MLSPTKPSLARISLWAARTAWVFIALAPNALGASLQSHSRTTELVFTGAAWVLWSVVTGALFWLSPLSLTATRMIVPAFSVGVLATVFADPEIGRPWPLVGFLLVTVVNIAVFLPVFSALHVQASAYGDERRLPLRVPKSQVLPIGLAWLLVAGSVAGVLFAGAAHIWWLLIATLIALVAATKFVVPQLHRFSRRWLVVVPAGVVVHDQLLLAETFMVLTISVTNVVLSTSPKDTMNLTGFTRGNSILIYLRDTENIALSPYLARLLGTLDAVHVKAYAVAPTLAGHALAALTKPPATT